VTTISPRSQEAIPSRSITLAPTGQRLLSWAERELRDMWRKVLLMTLGNMRQNGVHTLAVWCLSSGCNHHSILEVSGYPDDVPVPSFGRISDANSAVILARMRGRIGMR
jgi:hypothetical protein